MATGEPRWWERLVGRKVDEALTAARDEQRTSTLTDSPSYSSSCTSEWTCSESGYTWTASGPTTQTTTLPPAPKMSSYVLARMDLLRQAGQQPTHIRVSPEVYDALSHEFPTIYLAVGAWTLFGLHGEVDSGIADFILECRAPTEWRSGKPVQAATFSRRRGMDL